jgi:hypothetical protein
LPFFLQWKTKIWLLVSHSAKKQEAVPVFLSSCADIGTWLEPSKVLQNILVLDKSIKQFVYDFKEIKNEEAVSKYKNKIENLVF